MRSFASLDTRLRRDTKALHNALWREGKGDLERLLADLVRDARDLDAFLGAGGRLRRNAAALAGRAANRGMHGAGESLFELLSHAYDLTAATEHVRKEDYPGAGDHLQDAVGSVTIGVCANAGCFPLVGAWERGATDFETYTGKLADVLERKGVARAGEWKRLVNAGYHLKRSLRGTMPKPERDLLARAAILSACWAALASVSIRRSLRSPPEFSYGDFAAVLGKIAARL